MHIHAHMFTHINTYIHTGIFTHIHTLGLTQKPKKE